MKISAREHPNLSYWRAGAEAFARLGLGLPSYYVCPLCLHGFTRDQAAILTREHVPPRRLGGRRLVLTCRACNSTSGHKLDSHASELERIRRFFLRKPGDSYFARYQTESGVVLNVEVEWSPGGKLSIAGLPATNAPGATERINAELTRRAIEGKGLPTSQLSIRFRHSVSLKRVSISWLRTAYLAAFAALGYRYTFREELSLVREQIQLPETTLIKGFYQKVPDGFAEERAIVLLNSPRWARGIAVHMDEHLVLLPFVDDAATYYKRLLRESKEGLIATFAGKAFPWPNRTEFRLDYATRSERVLYLKIVEGKL